jgi:uncharacterized membrane protein
MNVSTRTFRAVPIAALLIAALALLPAATTAQVMREGGDSLSALSFKSEILNRQQEIELFDNALGQVSTSLNGSWQAFRVESDVPWQASVDRRTGLVAFAEGGGIGMIPGHGNALTRDDIAVFLNGKQQVDLAVMEAIVRDFLKRTAPMLGVDPAALVLNRSRSGQPAGHVWFVDFDVYKGGLPIEGARVVFRINNGNLIQFGTEHLPAPGATVPDVKVTKEAALAVAARYVGGFTKADTFRDAGSQHLLPALTSSRIQLKDFEFGRGRGMVRVWQFVFHRDGVMGNWRARVDASTGALLEFGDINEYAQAAATGGTYLDSAVTGAEVVRPSPFTNLSTGGFSNSAGIYTWNGGALTSSMQGQYVRITDTCGSISLSADGSGNLAFGTSSGTDCTTPGVGGAGNTHASREQFYQVNRIKEVGRSWLPANTWLTQQLNVNVNLNQTCNAYWDGTQLNFFKSGGGCSNTGELAGVSLHEYGHGLDSNDGNGDPPDHGSGEATGDFTAALSLHESCIGPGFLGSNCNGYGNACTACTGVRDLDFAKHASNAAATVANFTQPDCPTSSNYQGPCGREGHCESYVASEALWDLPNRDLPNPGSGAAWTVVDRLWFLSRSTSTAFFSCTAGGTFTSNGCNAGSMWKVFRAIDDDDGNLGNGTPHGGAIFAALNRHGIACTTDPGAQTTFAGCTPPAVPTITVTPGNNQVAASWTSSGSAVYDVFRNERGCNAQFIKIGSATSATSLTDSNVANGLTYYYQVTAFPSGNEACASAPSTCVSVTPTAAANPDFTIAASPTSTSIAQGGSGNVTITTTVSNGFNNAVALSASGQPSGVTVAFNPTSIAAPGAGSSTMTITVGSSVATGTSTITVTGTGGSTTHTATVTLTVTASDFTIAASPTSTSIAQGAAGNVTISTTISGAFNSAVALTASGQPSGVTVAFNPTSIPAPGSGSSTMTITVASTAATGTSTITVTGTAGSTTHTATVTLTVTGSGFSISASPTSTSIAQGGSGNVTVSTAISGSFNSAVALSATGQPTGVTVAFNPTSIAAPGSGSSTMTITVASSTVAGTYPITVTGTGGSQTHSVTVTLTVTSPDFTIAAAPTSTTITQGTAGNVTITTTVSGGFNSAVALSASGQPTGVTVAFNPTSIAAPGAGSSTMTITVAASAATGTSTITVTGTGGSTTHNATVSLTVTAPSTNPVVNGGFETGNFTGWTAAGAATSVIAGAAHSGSFGAQLGSTSPTNGDSTATQTFTMPASSPTLTFWYNNHCPDTLTYDWATVTIKDNVTNVTTTLLPKTCQNPGGTWTQVTYNAAANAGHSVTLTLLSHDDNFGADPTYTWYDDVVVTSGPPDTTPPTTSITSPANNATVSGTITVTASASDNVGVVKVEFYIDSVLKSTVTTSPYNFSWNTTTVANGSHTIFSKAYDAANNVGTSATVTVTVSNSTAQQLLLNPGFESGAANWTATPAVIAQNGPSEPAHTGTFDAWMDGYGTTHTDSILQQVTIPSTITTATLSFWLHIDTAETTTTLQNDVLKVQIRNSSGTVLATLATFSNLNAATGYQQQSYDVSAYKGQTIQVFLTATENASLQTSFVADDFALNVQ